MFFRFQLNHETIEFHRNNRKPHSTPATLFWLRSNFQLSEGACIPRCEVYCYYVDFCNRSQHQPVNAASFGKVISTWTKDLIRLYLRLNFRAFLSQVIRQMFPHLTTRRLGTRGKSRYHYYGLAVKKESIYYRSNSCRKEKHKYS